MQTFDCSLEKLHSHIQLAMSWTNSHLHKFKINSQSYGDSKVLNDGSQVKNVIDSKKIKLTDVVDVDALPFRFLYEYDFGNYWIHEILVEKALDSESGTKYPRCIDGARCCPPEDVGGLLGYQTFLNALADPEHEDHDRYSEWGSGFDAEEFDVGDTTRAMQAGL